MAGGSNFKMKYPKLDGEPVINVPIPYWGVIPGGLQVGRMISVFGQVPYGASRFNIDFSEGADRRVANVALHTSVRFDQRVIVRNSYVNGRWQEEERQPNTLPLSTGNDFEVMFLVERSCFKIAVNGRHFANFAHRLPVLSIDKINIEGSVRIKKIEYSWQTPQAIPAVTNYPSQPNVFPPSGICIPSQPQVCPPGPFAPPPAASSLQPVYNPALPFTYPFYGGLHSGMMIYISGRPTASAERFEIDLQTSAAPYPPPDIAFHLNPRFGQNIVIRNSRISNSWGSEERHGYVFPFALGVNFDMIIRVESDKFMVAVNGKHFAEFRHRMMPLSRVNTLYIEGDAIISCIRFQ